VALGRFGRGEAFTEAWWRVAVPMLAADHLSVRSNVRFESGCELRSV
jgi:hypothetical protein